MPRFDLPRGFGEVCRPKTQRTLGLDHRDDERRFAELHPEPAERRPAAVALIVAMMALFGLRRRRFSRPPSPPPARGRPRPAG